MKPPAHPLATLEIEYCDAEGDISTRVIDVVGGNMIYIEAYCRLRKGLRTFIPEQIKQCKDVATGEIVQDVVVYLYEAGKRKTRERRRV